MQATMRRDASTAVVASFGVAARTIAVLCAAVAFLAVLVTVSVSSTDSVQGGVATVWMSGEARGRVVLSAARSERPSIAIELDSDPTAYDLADLDSVVLVHDRGDGSITVLDGRDGSVQSTSTGPTPVDERSALVAAGSVGYLVDAAALTMQRIDAGGTRGDQVPVGGGFTDWVATPDGTLWFVDTARGTYGSFDGESVTEASLAAPGTELRLTAAGNDPAVFDPSTNRLRWLRELTSVEIPGAVEGAGIVVQDPDPSSDCVAVIAATTLSCVEPEAVARSVEIDSFGDLAAAQLIADEQRAVLVRPGSPEVIVIAWDGGAATAGQRGEPSQRRLSGWTSSGPIVIDDPGSRYAFTVVDTGLVELDKFSKRTIVINPDGSAADGVGTLDENADVAGIFSSDDATSRPLDDDQINEPPIARPDQITTRTGRSVTIGVLSNDVDPDGDPLSVIDAGPLDAADGVVTVLEGSRVNYASPDTSADRTIAFDYRIADIGNLESASTVTVELIGSGRNTAPVLADDRAVTLANTPVDVAVLDNDSDNEGDPLSVTSLSQPEHGSSAIGAAGVLRYEPSAGFTGTDRFSYTALDGYGGEATANVEVIVENAAGANRPPVALDDRASTAANQRVQIQVLANDSDPDGDVLRLISVSNVPGITVTITADQVVDVVPGPTVAGLVAFDYTVADAEGLEDTARVALFVEPVTTVEPPTAVDDFVTSASVPTTIDVVANDVDPSGSQLVVDSLTQPPAGRGTVVRVSPTTVQFTPVVGATGTVRFTYTVMNVDGLAATATVSVEVTPRSGSTPLARNDSVQIFPGEVATVRVLDNDSHPDGLPFDFAGPPVTRSGAATVNADRAIVFTPPNGELTTYVLTYTIQDLFQAQSRATLSVTVVARPTSNTRPIALPDLQTAPYETAVTIDVLSNDIDPDGDVLRIVSIGTASQGRAEIASGQIRYTPPAGFAGAATVSYVVADPSGEQASATVTIAVAERIRVAPVANPDLLTVIVGTTALVAPLVNDVDPDGTNATLRLSAVGTPSPAGGVTVVNTGGTVRVTALTNPGTYTMSYVVTDADDQTAVGTITVVVQPPPNAAPIATPDVFATLSVPSIIAVLDNDLDPDGGVLTLVSVTQPSPAIAGTTAVSGDRVLFTPVNNFSGLVTFTYSIRDAQNATSSAMVTISVQACPTVPVLAPISAVTRFDTPVAVGLFGAAGTVPAGTTVTVAAPTVGSAALSGGGSVVTYTPAAGFNGVAIVGYSVRTTCGAVASGTVAITVNRAPLAVADVATTARNRDVAVPVLANDTDIDGDVLRVLSVEGGVNGTPRLTAGAVTFSPAPGFVGTATFTYRIADIGGLTSAASVTVTVSNAAPVAVPDFATTARLVPVTVAVIANDTDANGDVLGLVGVPTITSPATAAGSVAVSGNSVVYTPGRALGSVVIGYVVTDGAVSVAGTLTVTVTNRIPVAAADSATIDLATQSSVSNNVVANDSDPDGLTTGLTMTVQPIDASLGSVSASGGVITFTRSASLTAPATVIISYSITDPDGGAASGTFTVTVSDSTPPPTTPPTTTQPPPPTAPPPPAGAP